MRISLLLMLLIPGIAAAAKDVNILDFGAKPDEKTINTTAIQEAIDQCYATGGGRVYIPAGVFVTGTLYLKSNIEFYLNHAAVLQGTTFKNPDDRALICIFNAERVSISGTGIIDGMGFQQYFPKKSVRRRNVLFENCKNVSVKGVTLKNSSTWVLHFSKSEGIMVDGIRIHSYANENNDGIDVDNCSEVVIANSIIDCEDDGIVMKSGTSDPVKNIVITNCIVSTNCNAIKFGTGSRGGFRNVSVSNCVVRKPTNVEHRQWSKVKGVSGDSVVISGLALEIVDGGIMEQVVINNISMTGVLTPIFIRLGNRRGPGIMKNVVISNITATNESLMCSSVNGISGSYIENVTIRDVILTNRGTGTLTEAKMAVEEKESAYPENMMFGYSLPAYGFYLRHTKGMTLENIQLLLAAPDERPAIVLDDCHDMRINGLKADLPSANQPLLRFVQSVNVTVSGYQPVAPVPVFLHLEGERTADIKLYSNDFSGIQQVVQFDKVASKKAVKRFSNFR